MMPAVIIGGTAAAGTLRVGNGIITTVGSNKTWKETSGRESGSENYRFGDMTKSVWNSFWGTEPPKDDVAMAMPLDTIDDKLTHLKNNLIAIQEEIDKYEDDENSEAILSYLKNKKKELKQEIKILESGKSMQSI